MTSTREHFSQLREITSHLQDPLLKRLSVVVEELISSHRELALLQTTEKQGKARSWEASSGSSVSARDRFADYTNVGTATEIIKVKGEIAAYSEERDFLRDLLKERHDKNAGTASYSSS